VLYAINGIMPIAICFRHGMVWAGVLGTIAMTIPLALAVAAGLRRRSGVVRAGDPMPVAGD
jgi:hypothetical protein